MAMFAIVYSVFKHVNLWDSKVLDDILFQGEHIYKDLKTNIFLNAHEIPRQVNYFVFQWNWILLETNLGCFLVIKKIIRI